MVTKTVQFWHKADTCMSGIEDPELNPHSSSQSFCKDAKNILYNGQPWGIKMTQGVKITEPPNSKGGKTESTI